MKATFAIALLSTQNTPAGAHGKFRIFILKLKGRAELVGRKAGRMVPHGDERKCLLLAHTEGVLGGLGGVAEGLGGRIEDTLALLGGVVVGAGDGVRGLLADALLAGGLGAAGNVVGGALDGVTGLLKARLLGVGLQGGGGLVGGGLAASEDVSYML